MSRSIFGFNSVTKWVTHQIGPMDTTHMLSIVRVHASEREASKCALILALGTVQHSKYTTGWGGGDFHFLLVRDEKEQDSEDGDFWYVRKRVSANYLVQGASSFTIMAQEKTIFDLRSLNFSRLQNSKFKQPHQDQDPPNSFPIPHLTS